VRGVGEGEKGKEGVRGGGIIQSLFPYF